MPEQLPFEISPAETKRRLDSGERTVLIDVREAIEHSICQIDGAHLIPMNSVPAQIQAIESAADESLVVVFCHHGVRSLSVVNWLRQQGVEQCQSMAGGVERWSIEIDSTVPRY